MDLPLPCPLEAGWELVRTIALPRTLADGRPCLLYTSDAADDA